MLTAGIPSGYQPTPGYSFGYWNPYVFRIQVLPAGRMCCDSQVAFACASFTTVGEITQVSDNRKLSPGRLRFVGVVFRIPPLENVPNGSRSTLLSWSQRK